jgi:uncharacterized surface protein with fasciclin (FAS1) repeats
MTELTLTNSKILVSVQNRIWSIAKNLLVILQYFLNMNSILAKALTLTAVISTSVIGAVSNANALTNHSHGHKTTIAKVAKQSKNIVQTAQATPSLSTLVGAVSAAGLVDTLSGKGPFTVFAPDNDAFAKINVPSDKATLTKVLTYHVVSGKLTAQQLHNGQLLTTVNGQKLKVIKFRNGTVKIKSTSGNIVTVKAANIKTSNGIVHVINNVLIPGK